MPKRSKKPGPSFSKIMPADHPFVRSKDFKTIYANSVKMSFTAFECRMTFVHISDDAGINKFVQEEKGMIVLHPVNAKILMLQLQKALEMYEEQIGPLNVPEDAKKAFGLE